MPLQMGLNSFLSESDQIPELKDYAPFKQVWPYALITTAAAVLQFVRTLQKDSKMYELKEKKIYTEKGETSVENMTIGKYTIYII